MNTLEQTAQERQKLNEKITLLKNELRPLERRLNEIYIQQSKETESKVKRCNANMDKFQLDELIFSAYAICSCGAGLAYPKNSGMHGSWYCSDILLGRAVPASQEGSKVHDGAKPFAFWEIKSEEQPSAEGSTTRPKS